MFASLYLKAYSDYKNYWTKIKISETYISEIKYHKGRLLHKRLIFNQINRGNPSNLFIEIIEISNR